VENTSVGFFGRIDRGELVSDDSLGNFLVQFYSLVPVTLKITYFFDISQVRNKLKASPRPISDSRWTS